MKIIVVGTELKAEPLFEFKLQQWGHFIRLVRVEGGYEHHVIEIAQRNSADAKPSIYLCNGSENHAHKVINYSTLEVVNP